MAETGSDKQWFSGASDFLLGSHHSPTPNSLGLPCLSDRVGETPGEHEFTGQRIRHWRSATTVKRPQLNNIRHLKLISRADGPRFLNKHDKFI